jgi:hypothetical protein
MKLAVTGLVALVAGTSLVAQTPATTPVAVPASLTLDVQLRSQFGASQRLLTKLADVMPADAYSFRPTPDVAPFAARIAHVAMGNFAMCATLLGQPNPKAGVDLEKTITDKNGAQGALAESFAFCGEYVKALTPEHLGETYTTTVLTPDGKRTPTPASRAGLLAYLVNHNNEMYGYLSMYLRLKGLVPPSSDTAGRGRGGR